MGMTKYMRIMLRMSMLIMLLAKAFCIYPLLDFPIGLVCLYTAWQHLSRGLTALLD